jgi:hypothetical protein
MKYLISFTVIILGVAVMYFIETTTSASVPPKTSYNQVVSDADMSIADFVTTTWDFLFGGNDRTPVRDLPVSTVDMAPFTNKNYGHLSVTWLGHSSLMINIDGYRVLTDPVFEKRVSILGPTRFNGDVPLGIHQLPPIDVVVISHDHYDHLNKYSIMQLKDKTKLLESAKKDEDLEFTGLDHLKQLREEAKSELKITDVPDQEPAKAKADVNIPPVEELEIMNVHQLRKVARSIPDFPIKGREISMANRGVLLDYLKKL